MASALFARVRRTQQNTQYTYSLGHRIHDVKTYPVQTRQGATVLIYGHESGLTLIWRGGRRLKPASKETQNGSNPEDAVMIIDSDDEAPTTKSSATPFVDKPEFEDEQSTSATSLPEIIQTLDLATGAAVKRIAVLPQPPCAAEEAAWSGAEILKEQMVFAVATATNNIYVVTLPLTPPSDESKARPELQKELLAGTAGKGLWSETLTLLSGANRPSDGIAITLIKPRSHGERSRSVERSGLSTSNTTNATRVIVAAHSREAIGTLRFWDVPLEAKPSTAGSVEPFQTEYLRSPLTGISFNPSHTTQLLAISAPQAARIYDYSIPSSPADDTSDGPFPIQGSWLLSLYAPFTRGPGLSSARKPIVAASWISNGRAILALLADGQWGIWDVDGASPLLNGSNPPNGLFGKQKESLRGSAITTFSTTGYLEGTGPLRNPGTQKLPTMPGSGSDFVPMTPHTRRENLTASMAGGPEKLAAVRGGIAVTKIPFSRAQSGLITPDEAAVLWLEGPDPIVAIITGIERFWEAQLKRGSGGGVNLFSGAQPTRMIRLLDLSAGLLGERCTGATVVLRFRQQPRRPAGDDNGENGLAGDGLPVEIVLQGESRLVLVHEGEDGSASAARLTGGRKMTRAGTRVASAIIAYPRPEKPSSERFNLSVRRGGSLRPPHQRKRLPGLFSAEGALPSMEDEPKRAITLSGGLPFASDLMAAADAPDDEAEAQERDVDAEIMDIMEIDHELRLMDAERNAGTKHVFFEGGI